MSSERRRWGEVPRDVGRPAASPPLRQMGGVLPKCELNGGGGLVVGSLVMEGDVLSGRNMLYLVRVYFVRNQALVRVVPKWFHLFCH